MWSDIYGILSPHVEELGRFRYFAFTSAIENTKQ